MKKVLTVLIVLAVIVTVMGCTKRFMVTDPATDKVFYTNDLERNQSGAIVFTDGNTGNQVTLQNSELKKIKKKEYKENIQKK